MAKGTAKANLKNNAARILHFQEITIAINAIHFLMGVWATGSITPSVWDVVVLAFWLVQEWGMIYLLKLQGQAECDSNGDLVSCRDISDTEQLGIYSYAQDCLWVCWAVQLLVALVSSYFVVLYFAIPGFAIYKLWGIVFRPLLSRFFGGGGNDGEDGEGKEQGDYNKTRAQRRKDEIAMRKEKQKASRSK